jgi:hypothetical protein
VVRGFIFDGNHVVARLKNDMFESKFSILY